MTDLPQPSTEKGRAGLAAILADPEGAVAALDYDGTLAPITKRPEDAVPAPDVLAVLERLGRRLGAVVLITGRPAEQLLDLSGLANHPAGAYVTVLAQYGLQRWNGADGSLSSPPPLPGVDTARKELVKLLADPGTPPGVTLEDKRQALVIHTRTTQDPDGVLADLSDRLAEIAALGGLEPHPAKNALELRPPGFEKGGALRGFVAERSARSVMFAGDDVGDGPAFDALGDLRDKGIAAVGILSDSSEVSGLRERVDLVLPGPSGVMAFLRGLADQLDGTAGP